MAAKLRLIVFLVIVGLPAAMVVSRFTSHPSLLRRWGPEQATLANIDIRDDDVTIHNIRDIDRPAKDATLTYFDRTLRLSDLRRAFLVVDEMGWGRAQLMISFEFQGPEYVVIWPEPRLEQ